MRARLYGALLLASACAHHATMPAVARSRGLPPKPASPPPAAATPEQALALEIASLRGLPLRAPLHVERVDAATFAERTRTEPADSATTATYVAFGFMRHDLHARAPALGHAGYLGIFDFSAHALVLRDDLGERATPGVFVHEIVHALQDQSFGMPAAVADDDAALAMKSLYEGDATVVRELWAAQREGSSQAERISQAIMIVRTHTRESLAAGLGVPESATRDPRFGETLSTYLDGMIFVAALWQNGGFARVDAAYSHLPQSTEQVLHPEKYLANESPVAVAAPRPAAGTVKLAEGTLGELRTRLLLGRCSKTPTVGGWGWGGDRYVVSEGRDGRLALAWSTEWDTDGDAMRFETALRRVSDRCWPSVRRDGWWIGAGAAISRSGRHVELVRGG